MNKVKEALDILYQTCLISKCDGTCPLNAFCEYIWDGHFDSVWETVEDVRNSDD